MPRRIALVPAAGTGSRFAAGAPKQYLPLAGQPMILHALATLLRVPGIARVIVLLAPHDSYWETLPLGDLPGNVGTMRCGGETRAATVGNALERLADDLASEDWVLVHDAARPCVRAQRISALLAELGDDPVGGLLAQPLADTLKASEGGRVARTIPRAGLWQAQTPQMFRYGVLRRALREAGPAAITDEAQAVEALGLAPRLVPGGADNLKVTFAEDLALAAAILAARAREGSEP